MEKKFILKLNIKNINENRSTLKMLPFFINLKYVNALHSNAVTMDDDKKIPISRKHVSSVRTNYLNFISQKGHLV